jgi:prostaglandin-H2 D-isomerase / glutathione transferase
VLTVDGETVAQSAAILRYAGKLSGLYPLNYIEAAKCDAVLDSIADMGSKLRPSMLEKDEVLRLFHLMIQQVMITTNDKKLQLCCF